MLCIIALFPHGNATQAAVAWSGEQDVEMGFYPDPSWQGKGDTFIDFTRDGQPDYHISFNEYMYVYPQDGPDGHKNEITAEDRGPRPRCWPLEGKELIGATLPGNTVWLAEDEPLVEWNISGDGQYLGIGPWYGAVGKFMGVRFDAADGTHYGWVRMSVLADFPAAIIHDWAYETVPGRSILTRSPTTHFVSPTGAHIHPFTNWTDAATNLQAAVDASDYGDRVVVTDGLYRVTGAVVLTEGITLVSANGRDAVTIDGQHLTRVIVMDHPDAVLRGITVANGLSDQYGGGIYCNRGSVDDCVVRDSAAYGAGGVACGQQGLIANSTIERNQALGLDWDPGAAGGVWCTGGRVENCTIKDNTAHGVASLGGGIVCAYGAVLTGSTITGNRANSAAGVACVFTSRLERCTIADNSATGLAGGLWVWGSDAANSLITGNSAATGGGTVLGPVDDIGSADPQMQTATSRLSNCTVVANTGLISAGGVMCSSNALIRNSIVWANAAPQCANATTGTPAPLVVYSCTCPLPPGTGNITHNPQLTPAFRLKSTSPCIDAGTSSNAPATDLDGEARWDHPNHSNLVSIVDIGADEFVDTDLDALADYWETENVGNLTNKDGTADGDRDGLNDRGEYDNSTTPTNPDSDADQMPDGWEVRHTLNPLRNDANGDRDQDALSNAGEYTADTDPQDAASVLALIGCTQQFGGTRIDWKGGRAAVQFLETSTDLLATNWTPIYALPPPTPLTNAVIDFGATNQTLFYRIRAHR